MDLVDPWGRLLVEASSRFYHEAPHASRFAAGAAAALDSEIQLDIERCRHTANVSL